MIRNNLELSDRLTELIKSIESAEQTSDPAADSVCFSLRQAIRESNMPNPNRWTLVDHLDDAAQHLAGREPYSAELSFLLEAANRLNAE